MIKANKTLFLLSLWSTMTLSASAQGTAFTYQGRLNSGTNPANGAYDVQFTLFPAGSGGSPIAGPIVETGIAVTNGLFTTMVDFGGVVPGATNWLELAVRTNGAGSFSPALTPRQQLTPTPYAVYAETANATNLVGTVPSANLSGVALRAGGNAFTGAQTITAGNVGIGTTAPNEMLEIGNGRAFIGDGGGASRKGVLIQGNGGTYGRIEAFNYGTFAGLPLALNNLGHGFVGIGTTTPSNTLDVQGSADFTGNVGIGTTTPTANLHVNGGIFETPVAAALFEVQNCGAACASPSWTEAVRLMNTEGNLTGLVGMGFLTAASGTSLTSVPDAWIGTDDKASGNTHSLQIATQSGGVLTNRVFINGATGNVGIGTTTPTGHLSVATQNGTVSITDDSYAPDLIMTGGPAAGHLRVRNCIEMWPTTDATVAGYFDVRNTSSTATISLSGSNGVVTCVSMNITSDRNAKKDFKALNPRDVLAKVAALPITEWQYKIDNSTDDAAPRHIGPMAQDFGAAFNLNHDDRHISVGDEGGVALAAIQGLNEELKETRAENAELKRTVSELKEMMEQIQRNLPANQVK